MRRFDESSRSATHWMRRSLRAKNHLPQELPKVRGSGSNSEKRRGAERSPSDFRSILDSIPVPLTVTAPSGELECANRLAIEYFGKSFAELRDWATSDLVHPEDLHHTIAAQRSARQTESAYDVESRRRRADGVYRWFNVRSLPLRDRDGRILRWFHLLIDIDDRKRAEEALRASEVSLRQIVDSIPGLVCTMSPAGEFELFNGQLLEYFGGSPEELRSWTTSDAVHPDDRSRVIAGFAHSIATGTPYDLEHRCRGTDRVYRWFQVRALPVRDAEGRITVWYVMLTDIDGRRQAEEALRASERNLRSIINTIPTTAWATRPDGYCEFLSHRWLDYAGFSEEQARGWGWGASIHPDDVDGLVEYWTSCLASGTPVDTEARMRRFDGVYRWFLFRANPLRDETGAIVKWYGTNVDIEDRKRADEALRASERDLSEIINTIPAMAWSAASDGSANFFNRHYLDYVGLSEEQAKQGGWTVAVHPDDLNGLIDAWRLMMASDQPGECEARLRRFDGEYRWFLFRTNPLRDEAGKTVKWYGTNTDIDDRKRAEEALRASERDLSSIINTIPMLAWATRPDGFCEFLNQRWLDYADMTAEEARGWGWGAAIHPDDVKGLVDYWQACIASGAPVDTEARMRRFDGEYRWFLFRASPLRDETGAIVRWYGTNTDIEDRKQAVEELRRSEAFLAQGQRLNLTGSFLWRVDTDEIAFSEQLYRIFEFEVGSPVTLERIAGRVHPDDIPVLFEKIDLARKDIGEHDYEIRLRMPDGSIKHLRTKSDGARDRDGRLEHIGAIQDLTEHRQAEEALARARAELAHVARITSLGVLTASIAHEVKQPLAAIITNGETGLRRLARPDPELDRIREITKLVVADARRASEIIDRIRAMVTGRAPEQALLSVNDVIQESMAFLRREFQSRDITVSYDLPPELPRVFGDRTQLQQVIVNLAINAAQAMSQSDSQRRSLVVRSLLSDSETVSCAIEDSGPGIDPTHLPRLFESFFTTKNGGMGLGLPISRSIVEAHGGEIRADNYSALGGARFIFTLPAVDSAAANHKPESAGARA